MSALIAEPGVYELDEAIYHADTALAPEMGRSLSSTGAKTILRSPALFDYRRRHPEQKDVYDEGSIAHALILRNADPRLLVVDDYDWTRRKGKPTRDELRKQGLIPIHRGTLLTASKMARAVRRHQLAAAILSKGEPERALFWVDEATGVTLRGRVDWLRDNAIVDVKTTMDASPAAFAKACANYGYDQQAAWYSEGVRALTGESLPFLFIAVEKEPPHLVGVYQLNDEALGRGARLNRLAIDRYAECESSGEWPAYSQDIEVLSLPRWAY